MDLQTLNRTVITPALQLFPPHMDTPRARVELLAIQQQEDRDQERYQRGGGPARGLWQFERAGGVRGVLRHEETREMAHAICVARGVLAEENAVWRRLPNDDILAACFARLLLWSDPKPMAQNAIEGWALYARTWRPGKPRPDEWEGNYARSETAVLG